MKAHRVKKAGEAAKAKGSAKGNAVKAKGNAVKAKGHAGEGGSSLVNLKIKNENIHVKNIVRTIHYVYNNRYDSETGFSYIKDILKNIIKGNVYDVEHKRYVNEHCIYELCARIALNMVRSNAKDENFNKMMDFLFDILYYCDVLLSERASRRGGRSASAGVSSVSGVSGVGGTGSTGSTTGGGEAGQEYELIAKLWNRLLDNIFIKDRKQRINLCRIVKALVKKACALQIDVSNKLCKKHVNIFLSLLNDKDHNIRILCLNILEPFQDFNTTASYLRCLDDSHNAVRIHAIKNIAIYADEANGGTNGRNNYDHLIILKSFLVRINDTNPNVRISVYEKLKSHYFFIPSDMKFELLLCGLNDKDNSVRQSCYGMVIHWVQHFDDKLENLLLHLINSDIDNDLIVEQICKIHLNSVRNGVIRSGSIELGSTQGRSSDVNATEEATERLSSSCRNELRGEDKGRKSHSGDGTPHNGDANSPYGEAWYSHCINNLFLLNAAELYMLRVYVQHFCDEQEKEKIDALKVINAVYYYMHLSRFNERVYYNRKNYINCVENNESDQADNLHLFCTCGKGKTDVKQLEEDRKRRFMETSLFDDEFCDKCMYYRAVQNSTEGVNGQADGTEGVNRQADGTEGVNRQADGTEGVNRQADGTEGVNRQADGTEGVNSHADGASANHADGNSASHADGTSVNQENGGGANDPGEHVLINEDNINENYNYICNMKNLLLICKYLDIIETYQVEKILQCCSTVLLRGPLREVIIKCMLNNTGVNYYKLQKGHITCAYWLSSSYVYACLELLRQMVYIKNKNCHVNDVEISLTNQILGIISEIKEPFENPESESPFAVDPVNFAEEGKRQGETRLEGSTLASTRLEGSPRNGSESSPKLAAKEQGAKQTEGNPLGALFSTILNVENDSIFEIIRKKKLNTLSIEHLLILCRKMQHKLDVTEAKIKDLTEMDRERSAEEVGSPKGDDQKERSSHSLFAFHDQIRLHTQIFLKQITMLSLLRLELKRRWLRILFILECFLCKSKSHCSFDSALREFPNELLLPALNFCCSIMPEWDDKEIEDQFYDIIVSKCLGNWCMYICKDDELKKQIYAYKTAIVDTCDVLNNCLLSIESIHEKVCPSVYQKANIDLMAHAERGVNKSGAVGNAGQATSQEEEANQRTANDEDGSSQLIFYEYNPPNESLLNYFATNQNAWYEYKELLEKLEINSLRCEIYICVLGDLLMTHPNLNNDEMIIDAIENIWSYLSGTVNTSKYIQSICLRVFCKLLLTEYLGNHIYRLSNEEMHKMVRRSSTKLRALFEMCFLISPSTYNCVQDFKKISTFNITNINAHDKLFLFSVFSMYPSMSETNLLVFHFTFEEVLLKTCDGVLKHKLKTINYTNILTFIIFTILHKANIHFLVAHFPKYIKSLLLVIIEKGVALTSRSNIVELVYKIIQIYLFHDLGRVRGGEAAETGTDAASPADGESANTGGALEPREGKKRGRKKKNAAPLEESNEKKEADKREPTLKTHTNFEVEMEQAGRAAQEEKSQKGENKNFTIFFKSALIDVNTTIKDLKTFFVLINFCMHSSDIIKSKNEIKLCEALKDCLQKKIDEVRTYFVQRNLVVGAPSGGEPPMGNTNTLLDVAQMDALKEESIYEEIINEYVNYIGTLPQRRFSYPVVPRGVDGCNGEEMSAEEIMEQIGHAANGQRPRGGTSDDVRTDNHPFGDRPNGSYARLFEKTANLALKAKYPPGEPGIEHKETQDEFIDANEEASCSIQNSFETIDEVKKFSSPLDDLLDVGSAPRLAAARSDETVLQHGGGGSTRGGCSREEAIEEAVEDAKEEVAQASAQAAAEEPAEETPLREDPPNGGSAKRDRRNSPRKLTELNISSSEESPEEGDPPSSMNDFESVRDAADFDDHSSGGSGSSTHSNDSTAMVFKRLNRLKRTSYTNVVSK
ncbi:merozoite organizing protein, putative [Plasmodium vivax]|nr:merozoite organizing protein, putative [Plasmodium vivax]